MSDKPDDPLAPRDVTILRPRPGAGRRPANAPAAAPAQVAPAAAPQQWTPSQAAPGGGAASVTVVPAAVEAMPPPAAPMGMRQQQVQHTAASLSEFTATGVNPLI